MKDFKARLSRFFATGFGAACAWILLTAASITFAGVQWKITSQGNGQIGVFDEDGKALLPSEAFKGLAVVNVRQSATTAAGAMVWAIQNPSATKTIVIKACQFALFFDGAAAATLMKYEVVKGTSVTTFSGGAAVTPLNKRTALSQASSVRILDTGLTVTGLANVQQGQLLQQGRVTQTTTAYSQTNNLLEFRALQSGEIELGFQEIFGIRQTVISVIGDNVTGYCEFAERLN